MFKPLGDSLLLCLATGPHFSLLTVQCSGLKYHLVQHALQTATHVLNNASEIV